MAVDVIGRTFRQTQIVGLKNRWLIAGFGAAVVGTYFVMAGSIVHLMLTRTEVRKSYKRMNFFQYATIQLLMILMMSLPLKIALRLTLRIKYVWVTPWFNV